MCIQDSLRRVSSSKDPYDAAGAAALAKRGRSRNMRATRRAETARELVRSRSAALQERSGRGKSKHTLTCLTKILGTFPP